MPGAGAAAHGGDRASTALRRCRRTRARRLSAATALRRPARAGRPLATDRHACPPAPHRGRPTLRQCGRGRGASWRRPRCDRAAAMPPDPRAAPQRCDRAAAMPDPRAAPQRCGRAAATPDPRAARCDRAATMPPDPRAAPHRCDRGAAMRGIIAAIARVGASSRGKPSRARHLICRARGDADHRPARARAPGTSSLPSAPWRRQARESR